jgi:hypothetical protein
MRRTPGKPAISQTDIGAFGDGVPIWMAELGLRNVEERRLRRAQGFARGAGDDYAGAQAGHLSAL